MSPLVGVTCAWHPEDREMESRAQLFLPIYHVGTYYCRAMEDAGLIPVVVPILGRHSALEDLLEWLDGLVIPGGGGSLPDEMLSGPLLPTLREQDRKRYDYESFLIKRALEMDMPLIGMCRGHQMINEVGGGTMFLRIAGEIPGALEHQQTLRGIPKDKPSHAIFVEPGTRLHSILGESRVEVNSMHRQSVRTTGPGFRVCAWAPDGVVEGIESTRHSFVLGLQFHPERFPDNPVSSRIFGAFAEAVANRCRRKGRGFSAAGPGRGRPGCHGCRPPSAALEKDVGGELPK